MTVLHRLAPKGDAPYRVPAGLNRGLTIGFDLQSHLQDYLGLAEREILSPVKRFARHAHTAIDVGAGDGWYTLYFLARAKIPHVYAFEPLGERRATLARNVALNGLSMRGLTLVPHCVGNGRDTIALDSLRVTTPCLVKVDVEGAECEVLDGATRLMAKPGVSWIIETHSRMNEVACEARLRANGYTTHVIPNAWWRSLIPERRPLAHNRWLAADRDDKVGA